MFAKALSLLVNVSIIHYCNHNSHLHHFLYRLFEDSWRPSDEMQKNKSRLTVLIYFSSTYQHLLTLVILLSDLAILKSR